jgi:hypothetical protein
MSEKLFMQYTANISALLGGASAVYFINLKDIAPLRTRSCKFIVFINQTLIDDDGQLIVIINASGEVSLAIRQPYLEGMLPYEYAVILKALKQLGSPNINVYFEASSVSDTTLNGHVHRISHYFNKRFYKYTETGRDYHSETGS